MTPKELNLKLISEFPGLAQSYHEQVSWQEGDDTGSHIVYGDVLVPVLTMLIESGNYQVAKTYFNYIEDVLSLDDEYATDVMGATVIESIFFDSLDKTVVRELLGEKSLAIWDAYGDVQ